MFTCTEIMRAGLAAGLLGAAACSFTEYNPGHCASLEGDATCERMGDGSRPYCRRGTDECIGPGSEHGCVAERPDDTCYSPCGGRSTIAENGACVMGEESSSSGGTGSSTGTDATTVSSESSSTGPAPCLGPEDCDDPGAPLCNDAALCVPCTDVLDPVEADAACAALDPERPLCRDDGHCVACTPARTEFCDALQLACDEPSGDCIPCSTHDQCQPAACNLYTSQCLPKDEVVHVGKGQQYATIAAAVTSFSGAGEHGTIIIHGGESYDSASFVDNERLLAFLAAPGERPRWIRSSGASPQLTIRAGSTAFFDGMQLSGNANDVALLVDGGRVWLDRSHVVDNNGGGILAQSGADVVLRNCFVGGDVSDQDALVIDAANASILSSTLGGGFGDASALRCTGASMVDARSSLFLARTDTAEVLCMSAAIEHSAAELDLGGSNTPLGDMATSWFFGYGSGDFHLDDPPPALSTAAEWQQGDPLTDIDGDPRPATDASPDYAGADVPL